MSSQSSAEISPSVNRKDPIWEKFSEVEIYYFKKVKNFNFKQFVKKFVDSEARALSLKPLEFGSPVRIHVVMPSPAFSVCTLQISRCGCSQYRYLDRKIQCLRGRRPLTSDETVKITP